MEIYDTLIPTFRNGLSVLHRLLAKAQAQPNGDRLLEAKIAEDMHPLAMQIRFLTNHPGEAITRLTDREFTSRDANDANLDDAIASLTGTDALLADIGTDELLDETETLVLNLPNGMEFTMTAAQYARDWVLPNFYFHLTTAYAILRSEGLEIGKADFLPQMAQYATKMPGT